MTVNEMHSWLDQLADKNNSAYFTQDEKDIFLNRAMDEFIHQLISPTLKRNERSVVIAVAPENVEQWYHALYPIIETGVTLSPTAGLVSFTDLETEINGKFIYILLVQEGNNPLTFIKYNELTKRYNNDFLEPNAENAGFTVSRQGIHLVPNSTTNDISFTLVKQPPAIEYNIQDCVLPATLTHNKITAIAAQLMGITTEHDALTMINQITE